MPRPGRSRKWNRRRVNKRERLFRHRARKARELIFTLDWKWATRRTRPRVEISR